MVTEVQRAFHRVGHIYRVQDPPITRTNGCTATFFAASSWIRMTP
jgi:hypothetical protein